MLPWKVTFALLDKDKNAAQCRVFVRSSLSATQAQALALAIGDAINLLSDCRIVSIQVTRSYTVAGSIPGVNSSISQMLVCVVLLENTDMSVFVMPGLDVSLVRLDGGGKSLYTIDTAVGGMVELKASLVNAITQYGTKIVDVVIAGIAR